MNHQMKSQDPSQSQEAPSWKFLGMTLCCLGVAMLPYLVYEARYLGGLPPLRVIALAFISGAIAGAAILGIALRRAAGVPTPVAAADSKRLHELEERLANMETINSFERRLAEEALLRGKSSPLQ